MTLKSWEKKTLKAPGAAGRVAEIEDELRLAAGLTALREQAGYSQRELARRMGVSQPRVAAIERSRNVTLDVLEQYVDAVGARLEVTVVKGRNKIPLITAGRSGAGSVVRSVAKRSLRSSRTSQGAGTSVGRRRAATR